MAAVLSITEDSDTITMAFRRPDKRNALNRELSLAVRAGLERFTDTPLPVVFRSETPGMFIAGSDVAELKQRTVSDSLSRLNGELFQRIYDHPWPTLAVVDGAALGGGCELALACDFRVTTEQALWGLPEVRLGIIPSAGGLTRLARLTGWGAATELVMTGRRITGREAAALGLVNRVATVDDLEAAVQSLLAELAHAEPGAVRLAKEAMRVEGDRYRLVDAAAQALCIGSDEAQRRMQALLDRTG